MFTLLEAKLGPEVKEELSPGGHSVERDFTRMVQSLDSGEVTSAAGREERHRAQTFETPPYLPAESVYILNFDLRWRRLGRVAVSANYVQSLDSDSSFCSFIVFGFRVPGWVCIMSGKGPRLSFFFWA